jgi:CheY-like chemotaxis protein
MCHYHLDMVIVGGDDLLLQSRIRATAQAVAAPIQFVRQRDALLAAVRATPPSLVILDLDCDPLDPLAVIRAMRADPAMAGIPLVGYGAHTHAERLQSARDAGCDRVFARSRFVASLPELINSAKGSSAA